MALHCGGTQVTDFSPLKGMPLQELYCPRSQISDLSPLRGMPLTVVSCSLTQVADLSPLKGMKLTNLDCYRTGVSDLSPLEGMPLQFLSCNEELVVKYADLLRDMKTLKEIGGKPTAEFWKENTSKSSSRPPTMAKVDAAQPWQPTPDQQAFFDSVAKLKPKQQVEAVRERLKLVNPEFDGVLQYKIVQGQVFQLIFKSDQVTDIWPVRALVGLEVLHCDGSAGRNGRLVDISPLQGMKLTHLNCARTQVSDLSPLHGMPLATLTCDFTQIENLSPLQGMPLKHLSVGSTSVSDLSPLSEMPLTKLSLTGCTRVSDVSPLQGMSLVSLGLTATQVTDFSPLQGMPLTLLYLDNSQISDLSPLEGMPLENLKISGTKVDDLSPLKGMPLIHLGLLNTQVSDLSPLQGMPLVRLDFPNTRVSDLSPLREMPLTDLRYDAKLYHSKDERLLKSLPLERLNDRPVNEAWEHLASRRLAAEEFVNSVTKLSAEEQVKAVRSRLTELDKKVGAHAQTTLSVKLTGEAVAEATLVLSNFSLDLTPLMAFTDLKKLTLTRGSNWLDLSPLTKLQLEDLTCSEAMAYYNAPLLAEIKTLKTINGQPAAEFWKKNASGSTSKPPAMAKVDTANPPRIKQNIVGRPSDAELLKRLSTVDWQPGEAAKLEGYGSFPSKLPGISFDWQILPKFSQHKYGFDISPKGTYVAVYHEQAYDPYIRILERKTGRLVGMYHKRGRYDRKIGWSPDESKFIVSWWNWSLLRSTVCRLDGTVLAEWSYSIEEDHGTPVPAWSPDGSRILLVRTKSLEQRTPDGEIVESFVSPGHGGTAYGHLIGRLNSYWSPQGDRFAVANEGEIRVFSKDGGQPIAVIKDENRVALQECMWHPSGEKILTFGVAGHGEIGAARLWTLPGESIHFGFRKLNEMVRGFSPDGRFLITNYGDIRDMADNSVSKLDVNQFGSVNVGTVDVRWTEADRIILFSPNAGPGDSVEFSPAGKKLAEYKTPIPIPQNSLSWMSTPDQFHSIGTSPAGSWNMNWGTNPEKDSSVKLSKTLRGFVAFSPTKQEYAGTNDNSSTYVYDKTGKQQETIKAAGSSRLCSWSANGTLLATAPGHSRGGPIEIWRGEENVASLEGHKHEVLGLSWSPDGGYLAVWDSSLNVSIWDYNSPEKPVFQKTGYGFQLGRSDNHWAFNISCPRWSPDGKLLAVPTENAVLLVSPSGTEDITVPMKKEDLGVIWWRPDGQALIVGKTIYALTGKTTGKLGEDNNSIPFLNWLSDEKLVTAWHRGVGIYDNVDQPATVLALPGFSQNHTPRVSIISRGMNAQRVSDDERYLIHHSGLATTAPNSHGGGDVYLIDLQEKRHLWTGLAYNDGTQVRIEPTGRVQTVPEDFDKYLTYIISYSSGPTIPQTRIQFASRVDLSAGQQLVQQALDIGGSVSVAGQEAPLVASDISDARDLPAIENVIGVDLSGNKYLNDDGLMHLGELTALEHLQLQNTSITTKSLSEISKLQRLRTLNLSGLNVTNSFSAYLPTNLEELDVSHTEVGDFFLFDLKTSKSLKRVNLTGTKVTPAGIASLKQALPDCKVVASQVPKTEAANAQ